MGDSNVTGMLLALQGRPFLGASHGKRSSPNPVSLAHARLLADELDARLPQVPTLAPTLLRQHIHPSLPTMIYLSTAHSPLAPLSSTPQVRKSLIKTWQ